jgi:type II secretory pathway pseudopilin PulG
MNTAADSGHPKSTPIVLAGLVGIVLVLVAIVAASGLFREVEDQELTRKSQATSQEAQALRAAQEEKLQSYRWVEQSQGVVGIPIRQAIALTIRESAAERTDRQPSPNSPE